MAESLGPPQSFKEPRTVRRSYPWDTWTKKPYSQHTMQQGRDFDVSPRTFCVTLRMHARTHGMDVTTMEKDDQGKGRVSFCFFDKGAPVPVLVSHAVSSMSQAVVAEVAPEVPAIVCELCGDTQARTVPSQFKVKECLITIEGKGTFAKHRPDAEQATGLRKVGLFGLSWSKEEGPR